MHIPPAFYTATAECLTKFLAPEGNVASARDDVGRYSYATALSGVTTLLLDDAIRHQKKVTTTQNIKDSSCDYLVVFYNNVTPLLSIMS